MVCSFVPSNSIYMQTQQPTKHNALIRYSLLYLGLILLTGWSDTARAASSYYSVCQNDSIMIYSTGGPGGWSPFAANPSASNLRSPSGDSAMVSGFVMSGVFAYIHSGSSSVDTAYVTVKGLPVVDAGPAASICYGDSVRLGGAPTASGGSGRYEYFWGPIAGISNPSIPNPWGYPQIQTTYIVTVIDSVSGCGDWDTVRVVVNALPTVNVTTQSIACYGQNTGSVCATATGVAPLIYNWSNGSTQPCFSNAVPGIYMVYVTDANGCTVIDTGIVTQPAALTATVSVDDASFCNGHDGSVCVNATGGAGPYMYAWGQGSSLSCPPGNLTPGTYTVTVTDANSCITTVTATVGVTQPLNLTFSTTDVTCNGAATGGICAHVTGGTPGYTYVWNATLLHDSCINNMPAGSYYLTVTDWQGCTAGGGAVINEPMPMVVTISVTDETYPGANDGSTSATVTGGTPPYMYIWGNSGGNGHNLSSGTYPLTVIDANACTAMDTAVVPICTTCVWPGDADNNLLVDNNDLLPIGLGYDSAGPARAVTSIVWQGNQATDWAQSFNSYTPAVNYKYADCNGDGTINATDTAAITQNFALTHSKTITQKPWRTGDPALYPLLSKDTVTNGDTLTVEIHLGDVSLAANNVYGIAYTINYDPIVLDTTKTTFAYDASWLGGTSELLSISRDITVQGMIKTAVTRIDHTTRSGSGVIAHLRAIVTTDNIDGKDLSYYPVHIFISDVRAVDQLGNVIQINEGTDSSEVGYTPLGIPDMTTGNLSVYPNPAHDKLYFTSSLTALQSAEVINTLGEIVATYSWSDARSEHTADVSSLSSGIYYIRLHTSAGLALRKITITH